MQGQDALDLDADFAELSALVEASAAKLAAHRARVVEVSSGYQPPTAACLDAQHELLATQYRSLLERIRTCARGAPEKRALYEEARTLQAILSGVLVAGDWQSPSTRHTEHPEAGTDLGRVQTNKSDYKRDTFTAEVAYARAFVNAYVDHPHRLAPVAMLTNSCMAAITTALAHLSRGVGAEGSVVAGKSTYFQTRFILDTLFGAQVTYVDEQNTDAVLRVIETEKPALCVFDTIGNSNSLPVPEWERLLPALSRGLSPRAALLLDNTTAGPLFQPLAHIPVRLMGPRLFVVESLSKYHQFGFDRTNAGMLWTLAGLSMPRVYEARMHLGTNISDSALSMLHTPDRARLEARLRRIERNATLLATRVEQALGQQQKPLFRVVYPGLASHPSRAHATKKFSGGFFMLVMHSPNKKAYQALATRILHEAHACGLQVIEGTGFGFTTARIFLPGLYYLPEHMSVRVSAGTETSSEVSRLGDAIVAALSQ